MKPTKPRHLASVFIAPIAGPTDGGWRCKFRCDFCGYETSESENWDELSTEFAEHMLFDERAHYRYADGIGNRREGARQ